MTGALYAPAFAAAPKSTLYSGGDDAYFSAVWVATVYNIDYPSKNNLSVAELRAELDAIVATAKEAGLDAIMFQVRPSADALYKSSVFPWSGVLTGTQGRAPLSGFDPLEYLCSAARRQGIEVHAWINPYRVTVNTSVTLSSLASNHPARLNPDWVIKFADGRMYFDPGRPECEKLVLDGVREIIENYDVAGIHFDDYFYPSSGNADFPDDATYAKYGGGLSKADWRRQNTYNLVKKTYELVKTYDENLVFGVSPCGVWRNISSTHLGSMTTGGFESYSRIYADTYKWVKDEIIDYIAPQIYWEIGNSNTDFVTLVQWWSNVVRGTSVMLLIGHAAYRVSENTPAWNDGTQIPAQIAYTKTSAYVSGSIFYNYSAVSKNTLGLLDRLSDAFRTDKPIIPMYVGYPLPGTETTADITYLIGRADPRYSVIVNGEEAKRTASGYFSAMVPLKEGKNNISIEYNSKITTHVITRVSISPPAETFYLDTAGFKPNTLYPNNSVYLTGGGTLSLSCVAPSGSYVSAQFEGQTVVLSEGERASSAGGLPLAVFSGSLQVSKPGSSSMAGSENLGSALYTVSYEGVTVQQKSGGEIWRFNSSLRLTAIIKSGDTVARAANSSAATRLTALAKGVTDYIVSETPTYYQLRYGGWVQKSDVIALEGTLKKNAVTDMYGNRDAYYTYIGFEMPVFAPYTITTTEKDFTVRFYNTQGRQPFVMASTNPLFSKISLTQDGEDAVYTLTLKSKNGNYGYKVYFSEGIMTVSFRHPPYTWLEETPLGNKTVILDAGHGGNDPGAIGPTGPEEKNEAELNLKVVKRAQQMLAELGAKVILTREGDEFVSLEQRADIIRNSDADLAISVHHNSADTTVDISKIFGTSTFYSEDISKPFALILQRKLIEATGRIDRGANFQGLAVCRVTQCPVVLAELGFISNPFEFESLSDETYIEKEARAITDAVLEYLAYGWSYPVEEQSLY